MNEASGLRVGISAIGTSSADVEKEHKDNIVISDRISEGCDVVENQAIGGYKNRPSTQLVKLIASFGKACVNLKDLANKIKERAKEEGFSSLEITLLARQILEGKKDVTSRQLNYWFPMKGSWNSTEESTSKYRQAVNTNDKKGIEKNYGSGQHSPAGSAFPTADTVNGIQKEEEDNDLYSDISSTMTKITNTTIPTVNRSRSAIPFLDLTESTKIDCTYHPMYQKATEIIRILRQDLSKTKDPKKESTAKEHKKSESTMISSPVGAGDQQNCERDQEADVI